MSQSAKKCLVYNELAKNRCFLDSGFLVQIKHSGENIWENIRILWKKRAM